MKRIKTQKKTLVADADRRPFLSYSQNFEDVLLNRVFSKVRDGFYVDVGAFDPVRGSVTKLFYDRGWSGINIEPGSVFERLAAERTRDINLNIAVMDRTGDVDLFEVNDDPATSFIIATERSSDAPTRQGKSSVVQCDTLNHIVEKYAADRLINFLKIDAEGSEALIINSVDWKRIRPQIIVVEATAAWTTQLVSDSWESCLVSNGYTRAYFDGLNLFFVRDEDMDFLKHFAIPVNILDGFEKYDPEKNAIEESLRSVWNENTKLVQVRDQLFNEHTAAVKEAGELNQQLTDQLAELWKQHTELVQSRDQLFNERAAALKEAGELNQQLTDQLAELWKQHTELLQSRDQLFIERATAIQQADETIQQLTDQLADLRKQNTKSNEQCASLWTRNAELEKSRDRILADRAEVLRESAVIALDRDRYRREISELNQVNLDLQASLQAARHSNAQLGEQFDRTVQQSSQIRNTLNSKIANLEQSLSEQSGEIARLGVFAMKYNRIVHELQAPDGPRAIRVLLPFARFIRMGRLATKKVPDMPLRPSFVETQSHSVPESTPAARGKTMTKSMLRPFLRLLYPIARPIAFRTRRYLLSPLDPLLEQARLKTDLHSQPLAVQPQHIRAQAQLLESVSRQIEILSQQLSALAAIESESRAEIALCTQRLEHMAHNPSPDFLKSVDCLVMSLAAHADRE